MNKKMMIIVFSVAVIAIVAFVAWSLSQQKNETQSGSGDSIAYYYGSSCSHCKKVAEFVSTNGIESKLSIVKKEVTESANKKNADEWVARAKQCGLEKNKIGVPFVYASGKCYMGDVEVIDFLKKEAGIQ